MVRETHARANVDKDIDSDDNWEGFDSDENLEGEDMQVRPKAFCILSGSLTSLSSGKMPLQRGTSSFRPGQFRPHSEGDHRPLAE